MYVRLLPTHKQAVTSGGHGVGSVPVDIEDNALTKSAHDDEDFHSTKRRRLG